MTATDRVGVAAPTRPTPMYLSMLTSTSRPITLPPRFRMDREIGRGGMAVVYSAHDHHLDRTVAIKVLAEELSNAVGAERFQREIALMAKLVHPGIVALFDSGEVDGRLFYVMPLVAGETLRGRLVRERRIAMEDAAAWGADLADALAYAHGLGIVHRDVKPENIFAIGGRALLSDFGIARVVQGATAGSGGLTTAGVVIGTTLYMSPEQVSGAELDGQSDLYSLGCVLYELLAGVPPFVGANQFVVLAKHLTESPRPLKDHDVSISPAMEAIVMQLLEKNPKDRPAGAAEVARALRSVLRIDGGAAERVERKSASSESPLTPADELTNRGRQAWRQGVPGGTGARLALEEARAYFERALAMEPNNARALVGMSNYHTVMAVRGFKDREEGFATGREFLFKALAADDKCADVYMSLGVMALYFDDDFRAAARHFRRALELDPNEPETLGFQSIVLKILGRTDEAVDAARAATVRAPDAPAPWNVLGDVLIAAGREAEAVDALKKATSIKAGYGPALERLELAYYRIGEHDRALETRASRLRLGGHNERADILEREAAELGFPEARLRDVRRELEGLLSDAEKSDPFVEGVSSRSPADCIVIACAELGEWSKAMDWIERAYQRRPGQLRRMLTDHLYDHHGLAVDPRYARLLRVAGLEELL
jgi:tetratricopeptide (TPR) repeat protein